VLPSERELRAELVREQRIFAETSDMQKSAKSVDENLDDNPQISTDLPTGEHI